MCKIHHKLTFLRVYYLKSQEPYAVGAVIILGFPLKILIHRGIRWLARAYNTHKSEFNEWAKIHVDLPMEPMLLITPTLEIIWGIKSLSQFSKLVHMTGKTRKAKVGQDTL